MGALEVAVTFEFRNRVLVFARADRDHKSRCDDR